MIGQLPPDNLVGTEMTIIAAVVLGGASITGGSGSISGDLIGTALLTILGNSLILLGIPTYYQTMFTGALIILGVGFTSYQSMRYQNVRYRIK